MQQAKKWAGDALHPENPWEEIRAKAASGTRSPSK
jgi:hypothetical protein